MKIVLSSFGSSGDFNPCLGLGRALRQQGIEVLFLSNPFYEKQISEAGLRFIPAGDYFDVFEEIRSNSNYLHPRKGPIAVWKMVLQTVPVMYQAMSELIEKESPDMVACHTLEYGGMIAAINNAIPYTTLTPPPMGWFYKPIPVYANFQPLPRWIRLLQAKTGWHICNTAFKFSLARHCAKNGIPRHIQSVASFYEKARLNLGLWSPLFRDQTPKDPPRSMICGFVRDEHIKDWPDIPAQIADLFEGPELPVVVGLGSTASLHGRLIYQKTSDACRRLNHPCLLVGRNLSDLSDPQNRILTIDFAPYGWVFPRAGLVVHHGGINTTAETLRAGVPAIVVPYGYDQFDNAMRSQQMGLAIRIRKRHLLSPQFVSTIKHILNDNLMHKKAQAFAARLRAQPDGGTVAAAKIISASYGC